MKVDAIMTRNVVTVEMDDRLSTVKALFDGAHIHHLLVVEGGELVGVISDRDLYRAISPNIDKARCTSLDLATLDRCVHAIMTRHPFTLEAGSAVSAAIALFDQHPISCIPIVESGKRIKGIVSWRDIIRHFDRIAFDSFVHAKLKTASCQPIGNSVPVSAAGPNGTE